MTVRKFTKDDAVNAYNGGVGEVVALFAEMQALLNEQAGKLGLNSSNSSKPSSTDMGSPKKRPNSRVKTGRNPGGQKGHKGSTLEQVPNPDFIEKCPVPNCNCGHHFNGLEEILDTTKRQVFDIPKPKVEVTEYHSSKYRCPGCGEVHSGSFPEHVKANTQYGPNLQAHAVYMMNYQMMPYKRTVDMFKACFGIKLSEGTLRNILHGFSTKIADSVEGIKQKIITNPTVHFDETGMRSEGKRNWLHVASTDLFTYYFHHVSRGTQAMNEAGVINNFEGNAIHDHWSPYYRYDCSHYLCNAHHLRDLQGVIDRDGYKWATDLKKMITRAKHLVDEAKLNGENALFGNTLIELTDEYWGIIELGYEEIPPPPERKSKQRGKIKKGKSRCLLERFNRMPEETLGFIYDFTVPFDNNLAERDIRMMKVKLKISGTFRASELAEAFCTIRSYISTVIKHGANVFSAITDAIRGKCFITDGLLPK
jgi:transposase